MKDIIARCLNEQCGESKEMLESKNLEKLVLSFAPNLLKDQATLDSVNLDKVVQLLKDTKRVAQWDNLLFHLKALKDRAEIIQNIFLRDTEVLYLIISHFKSAHLDSTSKTSGWSALGTYSSIARDLGNYIATLRSYVDTLSIILKAPVTPPRR